MAWPSRETTCTSANFYTYLVPTYCFNECIFTIKFIEIIKQKITRGIIHNTVMGPNSLTHTHRHRAYILDSFRTKPTARGHKFSVAINLLCIKCGKQKTKPRTCNSFLGCEHSKPSKLQFISRDFPRALVDGCGHLQKHTQFSRVLSNVAVPAYIGQICKYNCAIDSSTTK